MLGNFVHTNTMMYPDLLMLSILALLLLLAADPSEDQVIPESNPDDRQNEEEDDRFRINRPVQSSPRDRIRNICIRGHNFLNMTGEQVKVLMNYPPAPLDYRGIDMATLKTILIIDDNEADQAHMKEILESGGYSVLFAGIGPLGLSLAKEKNPDLIILDLIMPERNGIEILREFKNKSPDIPVLMCSAAGLEQVVALAMRVGAEGYIVKPYEGRAVLETISRILNDT
jgi:two-component system, chemotaxis family, chemotaxis protein CheY